MAFTFITEMLWDGVFATASTTAWFLMLSLSVLSPLFLLVALSCALYRCILNLVLKIEHGSNFGGLLEGMDNAFVEEEVLKCPSVALLIIEYDKDRGEDLYLTVKNLIIQKCSGKIINSVKILSTVHKFGGYAYLLKNQVVLDDCINKLQTGNYSFKQLDKGGLMKMLSDYHNSPFPNQDQALWEVLVGTQAIQWRPKAAEGRQFYPIIFRYKHVLGDGLNIGRVMFENFADCNFSAKVSRYTEMMSSTMSVTAPYTYSFIRNVKRMLEFLYVVCFCITKYVQLGLATASTMQALHGPRLTRQKLVLFALEDAPRFLKTIKSIRKEIPGSAFIDIVLTAVGASLNEYYEKNALEVPKYIKVAIPEIPISAAMGAADLSSNKHCRNLITFSMRNLPIRIEYQKSEKCLTNRLRLVMRGNYSKSFEVVEANYQILKTWFGYLPGKVTQYFMNKVNVTAVISNLPGPLPATFLGGYPMEDMLVFAPHRERTGVVLMASTYCDRLNLTLTVDKVLVNDEKQANDILSNVYKYIDLLSSEISY